MKILIIFYKTDIYCFNIMKIKKCCGMVKILKLDKNKKKIIIQYYHFFYQEEKKKRKMNNNVNDENNITKRKL